MIVLSKVYIMLETLRFLPLVLLWLMVLPSVLEGAGADADADADADVAVALKKRPWTSEEDRIPHEDVVDVAVTFKKGPWTSEEDRILADYVNKHGDGNWNAVQKNSGLLRCGKSCRLRWINHLRPNLRKDPITTAEANIIVWLHSLFGNKWAKMVKHLPGRTDNEIKNFWNTRRKRLRRARLASHLDNVQPQVLNEEQQQIQSLGGFEGDSSNPPPYELSQENVSKNSNWIYDYANSNLHQTESSLSADVFDPYIQSTTGSDPFSAGPPPLVHSSDEPQFSLGRPNSSQYIGNFEPSYSSAINSSNDHALVRSNSFAFGPFNEQVQQRELPSVQYVTTDPTFSTNNQLDTYAQAHVPSTSVQIEYVAPQYDGMLEAVVQQGLSYSRPQPIPESNDYILNPVSSGREASSAEEFLGLDEFADADKADYLNTDITEILDADIAEYINADIAEIFDADISEFKPQHYHQHCGIPASGDGKAWLDSSLEFKNSDPAPQEKDKIS